VHQQQAMPASERVRNLTRITVHEPTFVTPSSQSHKSCPLRHSGEACPALFDPSPSCWLFSSAVPTSAGRFGWALCTVTFHITILSRQATSFGLKASMADTRKP